ncbi:MAG: hypothetical protein U5J63_04780 [Fodinibius sp.]|nr:hypothetical protein [Fodinibius sp.]
MLFNSTSKLLILGLSAVLLSSCIATKSYKKPPQQTDDLYPFEQVNMDSTTLANMPWEKVFEDPRLRKLINEALQNNLAAAGRYSADPHCRGRLLQGQDADAAEPKCRRQCLLTTNSPTTAPIMEAVRAVPLFRPPSSTAYR